MDEPPSPAMTAAEPRQKRVQPSRSKSKRIATGVGSNEVDIMILETQKRKQETEPLIPVSTKFFLTTNSTLASSSTSESSNLNVIANERYFNRPEVLESFRKQSQIETPSFVKLDETHTAGRLRARSQSGSKDEDNPDLADAIYLKRHRKFEHFEKRGRLREKEKLQHEHYKLKERIEQLEKLDGAAFMSISPEYFPALQSAEDTGPDTVFSDPNAYLFGAVSVEGEKRRKEMLNTAHSLEERYRRLLPPRKKPDTSHHHPPSSAHISEDTEAALDSEELPTIEVQRNEGKPVTKPKSKLPLSIASPTPASLPDVLKKSQKRSNSPSKRSPSSHPSKPEEPMSIHDVGVQSAIRTPEVPELHEDRPNSSPKQHAQSPRSASQERQEDTNARDEDGHTHQEEELAQEQDVEEAPTPEPETISKRPSKRRRLTTRTPSTAPSHRGVKEMSVQPTLTAMSHLSGRRSQSRASTVGPGGRNKPSALENYAEIVANGKSKRQVSAFGVPLPPGIASEIVDYQLPWWVFPLPAPKGGYLLRG